VDFDFVASICGLVDVGIGALRGAFGDGVAGVLGEVDSGALGGTVGDEMAGVLRVLFLAVDLEIVLEWIFECVLESLSEVAGCALAVGDIM
jgi:hypothetical protein